MGASLAERQHVFTFEEYIALAAESSVRLELWDGRILDMSGGSPRHSKICANLLRILGNQLRGRPCQAFDANLRVRSLAANRATYADVTVVCGPLSIDPSDKSRHTVLNPAVLFEVLSPTTEGDDRGPKLDGYTSIPGVRAVVLVSQDEPEIELHEHQPDGRWVRTTFATGSVPLEAIGCILALDDVYESLP